MACYLVKSEGPDRVGGQLHCVQQSDLNEAVGLCAPGWPVLIALHLEDKKVEAVRCAEKFRDVRVLAACARGKKGEGACWCKSV